MDFTVGHSKPSAIQKARRLYGRLTTKGKLVLGVLSLLILYLIFPSWSSNSDNNTSYSTNTGSNDNSVHVSSKNMKTLSDLLAYSPKVKPISLNYMSLPPYLDSNMKFPHYKNGGNMLLSKTADYVTLVKDSPKNSGHMFSLMTISNDDLSSFEVEIEFKISGKQDKRNLIGDGMALWLTTEQLEQGDVFGMQSDFNGLGIFIDTYKNQHSKKNRNSFPYLSVQRNNGNIGHYDKNMDGLNTQIGGCSIGDIYNNENPTKLRFTYIRQANIYEIDVDMKGTGQWKTCVRNENVNIDALLPIGRPIYVGVSAETGDLHHNVDLYSIDVKTFRLQGNDENGQDFITEIDTLGQGIQITQDPEDEYEKVENSRSNSAMLRKRKQRRRVSRLKRQEKELKKKDFEKYGSEHGFVGWFFGIVWSFIKYTSLACIVGYACVIGLRVYKDKMKQKNSKGLL